LYITALGLSAVQGGVTERGAKFVLLHVLWLLGTTQPRCNLNIKECSHLCWHGSRWLVHVPGMQWAWTGTH
jgi:hypothetical protein